MAEIRNLTRNGETFYPLTHVDAIVSNTGSGIDDVPTYGSDNLVKSGGVYSSDVSFCYGDFLIKETYKRTGLISGAVFLDLARFTCYVIPVTPLSQIIIKGNSKTHSEYSFLQDDNLENNVTPNYASPYTRALDINNGEEILVTVPSTANYLYFVGEDKHENSSYIPEIASVFGGLFDKIRNYNERILGENILTDKLYQIQGLLSAGKYLNINTWVSYLIPVNPNEKYLILANSKEHTEYALLQNNTLVNNQMPNYADGFTRDKSLEKNESIVLEIPYNATYLYVIGKQDGQVPDYTPLVYNLSGVIGYIENRFNIMPKYNIQKTQAISSDTNYEVTDLENLSGKTWNAVGTSLTEGYSANNPHTELPVNKEELYVAQVAEILNLTVRNYGEGGTTICKNSAADTPPTPSNASIVERILGLNPEFLYQDADIWTIEGGANDIMLNSEIGTPDSTSIETVYGALKAIAENLQARSNNPRIIFIVWAYISYEDNRNDKARQIEYAFEWVGERYGIPVLNLRKISGISFINDRRLTIDGVHITEQGTNMIKHKIANFIKNNI